MTLLYFVPTTVDLAGDIPDGKWPPIPSWLGTAVVISIVAAVAIGTVAYIGGAIIRSYRHRPDTSGPARDTDTRGFGDE
ncbi:hypothetical protein [Gordonia sp. N1V]|uniref:hypothetical protein n=1 Tax=Gordonia sp. N1V TaxID=3034163 RepID=UPI0023E0CBC8|nr:hypothetical protein [Gordonia sp. N1V]MDF3285026.1 hypothetical protein [Gordonia sp. N1V]